MTQVKVEQATVAPFKNGVKVTNGTPELLDWINNNYGNGLDWVTKGTTSTLFGLFGVVPTILQDLKQGNFKG